MILKLETELAVKEATIDGTLITTPDQVERYLAELKSAQQECFVVIALNAKNRVIEKHLVSLGTVSSTLVHPREVFRALWGSSCLKTRQSCCVRICRNALLPLFRCISGLL